MQILCTVRKKMKCSGSQRLLCIFAIPCVGRGEGAWLNPSASLLWFLICTCWEEALPWDINPLLPSVEFSLVFVIVLPLQWCLDFLVSFVFGWWKYWETCCVFRFWGQWNKLNPLAFSRGMCHCFLVLEVLLASLLFWVSSPTWPTGPATVS